MKKIFAIGLVSASLVACSQKREAALDAREAQLNQEQKAQDSIRIVEDTKNQIESETAATAAKETATHAVVHSSHTTHTATASTPATATTSSTSSTSTASTTTPEEKKKGLNNKAKGAIIGAGVGAVTGAVVDKDHRGIGALIGAGVGAGAGLGAGAIIDKKQKDKQATGGN